MRVARRRGYVSITGRTRKRGRAGLFAYRMNGRTGLFAARAGHRWRFVARHHGRFSFRLRGRALRTGTWRVVVRQRSHARWVAAAAVLRG